MKYLFIMVMLATMLFSQQKKQIILGSFSIESNALFYSLYVQKHVDRDAGLKRLMDKYALKIEYKKVGDYNVVSISPFENYPSLFETIAEVKKHYPEAYAINFPANKSQLLQKPLSTEPTMPEVEEDIAEPEQTTQEAQEIVPEEEIAVPDEPEIKYEPQKINKPVPLPRQTEVQNTYETFDLVMLIVLLLVLIGFVVYKIQTKKEELPKEELSEED